MKVFASRKTELSVEAGYLSWEYEGGGAANLSESMNFMLAIPAS